MKIELLLDNEIQRQFTQFSILSVSHIPIGTVTGTSYSHIFT